MESRRWADITDGSSDSEPEDFPFFEKPSRGLSLMEMELDESSPVDTPRAESESRTTHAGSSAQDLRWRCLPDILKCRVWDPQFYLAVSRPGLSYRVLLGHIQYWRGKLDGSVQVARLLGQALHGHSFGWGLSSLILH